MANYTWITKLSLQESLNGIVATVEELGFEVNRSASSEYLIVATRQMRPEDKFRNRVRFLASWHEQNKGLVRIEVTSDEPMLLPTTNCRFCKEELKLKFPASD
jgi:hypothetical protein